MQATKVGLILKMMVGFFCYLATEVAATTAKSTRGASRSSSTSLDINSAEGLRGLLFFS